MRTGHAGLGTRVRLIAAMLVSIAVLGGTAAASTSPPHDYYLLSPEPLSGPLSVMSLEPNNTITFGSYQVTLQQYETATLSASSFTSGTKFSGTGFFTLGSNENAADLLVPDDFAGTAFVVPHIAGSHKYYLLSPAGNAQVTVRIGANTYSLTANEGIVNEFDAGSDNSVAGRITSDLPVVVAHVAYVSGSARDAYPVAPASAELFGVRSQNTLLAALSDGTSVTVYASNGTSATHSLDAGQQVAITTGAATDQGQGSALHIVASAPVGAVQYDDGDGIDATAFWTVTNFGRRHGLPVNAQYLAVVCDQASVVLTLYRAQNAPETQNCSGSSTTPGKAYFGSSSSGTNLSAGWYLISSSPVYAMYEAAAIEDEHNVLGLTPNAGPASPTLNAISSPTTNNPQSVSGTAGANQTVRLYVNGLLQATATANGSGVYTFNAALVDGTNTLYTTAVASGNESDPSNVVSVDYNNTIPRSQSGTINGTVVWTSGNPAQPYTVTAADLTIAAGAQLILQPGTQLRFGSGRRLTVNGTLKVSGTAGSNVVFTSDLASPTRGSWVGLVVNSTATAVSIERATIEWAQTAISVTGTAATIRNNTIRYFSANGILISGAGASGSVIQGNLIDNLNDTVDCIEVNASSPQIVGNTLTNCANGLHVFGASTSSVSGNNVITSNTIGVRVNANLSIAALPVVTGNQIHANATFNYQVSGFSSGGSGIKLNATANWWGFTDPTAISTEISDLSDNYTSSQPTVDYSNFLSGPEGAPVSGNYLIGRQTVSATLTGGVAYDVLGVFFVGSGTALTIPAGTTLRFHGNARLVVDGTLTLQGTGASMAVLTSGRTTPARGDWPGVLIRASGSLTEYARIEYAVTGVFVAGVTATVRNSTIRYFEDDGIYVDAAGASGSVIQGNLIDNLNDTGDCIETVNSSPSIIGNTLTNCDRGLSVYLNSSPSITGNNVITSNDFGIQVNGNNSFNPAPIVNGNQIHGNTTYNYQALNFTTSGSTLFLNARNNWWGTTDLEAIEASIYDLTASYTNARLPTVDWSSFLDSPNGTPVPGNYLMGPLAAASTTLTAGATYEVLGVLFVPAGKSLTVPAGTVLRFHGPKTRLVVDGTLSVQGAANSKVRLTSGLADPTKGAWQGIEVRATATAVLIDHAIVEFAVDAIAVTGANVVISNSIIRNFLDNGIRLTNVSSSSQITANYIDNYDGTGYGINLSASSPSITGNQIYRTSIGIFASGASNPTITGNAISNNGRGIVLDGNNSNSATAVPNPVITGNDIFGNTTAQIEIYRYGASNPVVINATNNWWGTTTPQAGQHIRFTSGSPSSTLNFTNPAAGPQAGPVGGNIVLSQYYFSPNGDSVKDTTAVSGTLNQSATWTITIRDSGYGVVRTYSGSGTSLAAVWDGQNGSGQVVPDGVYNVEVTATGAAGNAIVGVRLATLDNTAPTTAVTSPAASAVITNLISVPVIGTAADNYLVNFLLQYGAGTTPSSWTTINTQTTSVSSAALGNWVIGNISGTTGLPSGAYVLRLSTSDKAGNTASSDVPITLDLLTITGVTQNRQLMKPLLGEQLQIGFTLSAPATAFLRIYPESGGALVKEITQAFASAGAQTLSWDGRNTSGAVVADEAYSFAIHASDGVRTADYDLPAPTGTGAGSGTVDSSFNANKNDFWKMNYTMNHFGRIRMRVSGCTSPEHYPYNWVAYPPGVHPVIWDGRGADGQLVSGSCNIWFDAPLYMKSNAVIVRGAKPAITGTGASPSIEVTSNPYRITHSYDHVSRITYRLDQDAYVTVKLLPPGVSDPASPQAITLVTNELQYAQSGGQPADHLVEWRGYEASDPNDILVSAEGSYTFAIQATSVASGATALYRGALQLWQ